jgi:hypothetical protein
LNGAFVNSLRVRLFTEAAVLSALLFTYSAVPHALVYFTKRNFVNSIMRLAGHLGEKIFFH